MALAKRPIFKLWLLLLPLSLCYSNSISFDLATPWPDWNEYSMDIYQIYYCSSPKQKIHNLSVVRALPGDVFNKMIAWREDLFH
jgi:hypothetical protein